jgi:eukaryotic-like serine/threonine-protein kinase
MATAVEKVKELLERAMNLAPEERAAFIKQACADQPDLQKEVDSLLAFEDQTAPWAERPLIGRAAGDLKPGERVGAYRILEQIGSGGMGSVYRAVRVENFRLEVALKLVHHQLSDDLARRFEEERQTLAELDHPHIAHILDGGTAADGRPFFVMELIEGKTIDRYCDEHHARTTDRLRLLLDLCSALEKAHQSLIVHRDLKPSNILVTDSGAVKLVDFGIAKRLDRDDRALTALRPMTFRYASPEQLLGKKITTSSDVYSLGVVLYELLAGCHPFAATETDAQMIEAISKQAPRLLSRAAPAEVAGDLVGDLDAIAAKALEKEIDRRYGSIKAMADDLRSHLSGLPISARPISRIEKAWRFVKRHRLAVASLGAVFLLSVIYGVTAGILRREAETARSLAEVARADAEEGQRQKQKALDLLKGVLRGAGPDSSRGASRSAFDLVREAESDLEREEDTTQAELLATIGQVYFSWGRIEEAGSAWSRAEKLLRTAYPQGHPTLAKAINNSAAAFFAAEDYARAAALYREALDMKTVTGLGDDDVDLAKSQSNLANALVQLGELEGVEELFRSALDLRRKKQPPSFDDIGQSLRSLGVFLHEVERYDEAESVMLEALETFRRAAPDRETTRLANTLNGLGRLAHDRGRLDRAESLVREALAIRLRLLKADHEHVMSSRLDLARVAFDRGDHATVEAELNIVKDWLDGRSGERFGQELGRVAELEGLLAWRAGKVPEARRLLQIAVDRLSEGRRLPGLHARRALKSLRGLEGTADKNAGA